MDGISGKPLPVGFPYKSIIEQICGTTFFPCLVGAIKLNETGLGQGPHTETNVSFDGGHGIMQLTSSYPSDWQTPHSNIAYAVEHFLKPDFNYWKSHLQAEPLIRAIAASYNAGLGNAQVGHNEGDLDKFTTQRYGERCYSKYFELINGRIPSG